MEKRLFSYGFRYEKHENLSWVFSREVDGLTQHIIIQRSQWGGAYFLAIDVDDPQLRIREMTDYDPRYPSDSLEFGNEEERCKVVNQMADIDIKYDIDKLSEKIKIKKNMVKPVKATTEMHGRKYEDVQDKLIELTSVFGNILIEKVGALGLYRIEWYARLVVAHSTGPIKK